MFKLHRECDQVCKQDRKWGDENAEHRDKGARLCIADDFTLSVRMIICISGLTGSGKTTIGEALSKALNVKHIGITHKAHVSSVKDVVNFTKNATPAFEKRFDQEIVEEAEKGDCVVSTWLSPWMITNPTLRVWLFAGFNTRVERKVEEIGDPEVKIEDYISEKDSFNSENFMKLYKIDINDHSVFDIEINTERVSVGESVSLISMLALQRAKKRFE